MSKMSNNYQPKIVLKDNNLYEVIEITRWYVTLNRLADNEVYLVNPTTLCKYNKLKIGDRIVGKVKETGKVRENVTSKINQFVSYTYVAVSGKVSNDVYIQIKEESELMHKSMAEIIGSILNDYYEGIEIESTLNKFSEKLETCIKLALAKDLVLHGNLIEQHKMIERITAKVMDTILTEMIE